MDVPRRQKRPPLSSHLPVGLRRVIARFSPGVWAVLVFYTVSWLIGLCAALVGGPFAAFLYQKLVLVPSQALGPRPWQIVTGPMLLVSPQPLSSFLQLCFLGLLLYSVGTMIERSLSTRRLLRVLIFSSLLAALAAAVTGRLTRFADMPVLLGSEPIFVALLAAFGFLYGDVQMMLWGIAKPLSGRVMALVFLGFILISDLFGMRWPDVAADLTAALCGFTLAGGRPLQGLRTLLRDFRRKRARRRYQVIDGGSMFSPPRGGPDSASAGKKRQPERWMN